MKCCGSSLYLFVFPVHWYSCCKHETFNWEVCCNVFFHIPIYSNSGNNTAFWFLLLLFVLHIFTCQISCVCFIFKVPLERIKNKKEKKKGIHLSKVNLHILKPEYMSYSSSISSHPFGTKFLQKKFLFVCFWHFRMINEQKLTLIEQ